ncbi:MAG: hypothetical protein MAG795_00864 [Candidatus Woesearchaeota archaeon]|nr:hypothetical protein [Candidatus Woesearchaeota archaeon]
MTKKKKIKKKSKPKAKKKKKSKKHTKKTHKKSKGKKNSKKKSKKHSKKKKSSKKTKSKKHSKKSKKKKHSKKSKKSSKHTKKSKKKSKDDLVVSVKKETLVRGAIFGVVFLIILFIALFAGNKITENQESARLEFYVMSQCPYGTQVEDGIKSVLDEMGDAIDFSIDFIAKDLGDGKFESLHGESEVMGNIVQLCAMQYAPDRYIDMIECMNKNANSIPGNWESCAKQAGINTKSVGKCYEGNEGKKLLSESILRSNARGASGSPTIYLNDELYQGGRDALSFKRAICNQIPDHSACKDIPACTQDSDCPGKQGKIPNCQDPDTKDAKCTYTDPVEVKLYVVNDKTCLTCDSSRITEISKQLFPGVVVEQVDVSSQKGEEMVKELDLVYVPAFVFEPEVTQTYTWENQPNVRGAFELVDEKYKIKDSSTGATRFVDQEKRAEFLAKREVTLGDNKPQIDFFVMSYCPYGNQAEEAVAPVYELLGDKVEFNPRFVIYTNYADKSDNYCMDNGKYCSMHGIQELNQNIREDCAHDLFGDKALFDFALAMNKACNANNADTCWVDVAEDLELDVQKIKNCEDNEGLSYAKDEFEMTELYGVTGSPSIFIEGEAYNGARSPEAIKTALCKAFEEAPEECSTSLGEANQQANQQATQGQC